MTTTALWSWRIVFLQYIRFARGRAESTTRKYAEAIALYHTGSCTERSLDWSQPAITAFHMCENRAVAAASAPGETGVVWTRASAGATMVG